MNRIKVLTVVVGMTMTAPATAQPIRYDVGRKFIAFEEAFDKQTDAQARGRAVAPLKLAFRTFMTGRLSEAGRAMDEARWLLASAQTPADDVRWRDAHTLRLGRPVFDAQQDEVTASFVRLYDPKVDTLFVPEPLTMELRSTDGRLLFKKQSRVIQPGGDPVRVAIRDVPEGDHTLTITSGGVTAIHSVSFVPNLKQRTAKLREVVSKQPDHNLTTNQRTLVMLTNVIGNLVDGGWAETAYPCHRLLTEAEAIAAKPDASYFNGGRSGQFWLTLNTDKSLPVPLRLFAPEMKHEKPRPIVIAVHGAGGSENLFFDGYGHGEIVRQCAKRGWYCVAPRASLFGVISPAAIVDELAKCYPVDKSRVFLIGHSMGAGQVIAHAKLAPDRYAGVAALGGASRLAVDDAVKKVPFYIGCGTEDFSFRSAQRRARNLLEAGVTKVEFRDYPDVEHIAVVQVALPDVFQWFDAIGGD